MAEALGVPQTSLYSCFASKSELLDLMYFEVAGRMFAEVDAASTWQCGLRGVGRSIREMLIAHPNWASLLSRRAPPLISAQRETLLSLLKAAGFSAEQAFAALASVILGAVGLMLVDLKLRACGQDAGLNGRLEALKAATADDPHLPVTHEAVQALERLQVGAIHEQSLQAMLRGFESWAQAEARS